MQADPNNGRQKRIALTDYGRELQHVAKRGLASLEQELQRRVGAQAVKAMQRGLIADWGPAPTIE